LLDAERFAPLYQPDEQNSSEVREGREWVNAEQLVFRSSKGSCLFAPAQAFEGGAPGSLTLSIRWTLKRLCAFVYEIEDHRIQVALIQNGVRQDRRGDVGN
jgi:hypothetical protein